MTTRAAPALSATIDALAPHVPSALVAPEALDRVRALAAFLPAALTRWLYLECRLGAGAPAQTDLIVNVESGAAPLVAAAAARFPGDDAWRRAAALAGAWPQSPARATAIESLWLEFDVDGGPPRPSVFVDFAGSSYRGDGAAHTARMFDALAALSASPSERMCDTLARCLTVLPPGATAPYVGVMLARPGAAGAVRLCVHGLAMHAALPYLRAVGWRGDGATLRETLHVLGDAALVDGGARPPSVVHIDIDAEGRLRAPVGLEYTLDRLAQLRGDVAERSLLARLGERGLLTEAQREGLRHWGGYEIGVLPHELWESVTARWVNHVKVVCDGGHSTAKAYLSAHHTPRATLAARDARRARGAAGE